MIPISVISCRSNSSNNNFVEAPTNPEILDNKPTEPSIPDLPTVSVEPIDPVELEVVYIKLIQ